MDWMAANKEWLLSGIAVAVPIAILSWFFFKKGSKQVQKSGKNSTNIQVGGSVNINQGNKDE